MLCDIIWCDMIRYYIIWCDMICLLTAIGLTPGGSSTVHIYTQTVHRTTQLTTLVGRLSVIRTQSGQIKFNDELVVAQLWRVRAVPCLASYALAFASQLRKKHGKTSVRVAEECQLARQKQDMQNRTYIIIMIHKHTHKTKAHKTYAIFTMIKKLEPQEHVTS